MSEETNAHVRISSVITWYATQSSISKQASQHVDIAELAKLGGMLIVTSGSSEYMVFVTMPQDCAAAFSGAAMVARAAASRGEYLAILEPKLAERRVPKVYRRCCQMLGKCESESGKFKRLIETDSLCDCSCSLSGRDSLYRSECGVSSLKANDQRD